MNNLEKTKKLLNNISIYRNETESKLLKWVEGPMPYFAYKTEILFGAMLFHQQILHKTHVVSVMMMDSYNEENGLKIYIERIGDENVEIHPKNENLSTMGDEDRFSAYEEEFKKILDNLIGLQEEGKLISVFPKKWVGVQLVSNAFKRKLKIYFYLVIVILITLLYYIFY